MRSLKCSEWLGVLECSWFYFPSEYTTAFSILWFCLNITALLSLKLQFNRLHALTWILSIKMRTFGACGEVRTHPVHPPWLRAWTLTFADSLFSLLLDNFNREPHQRLSMVRKSRSTQKKNLRWFPWLHFPCSKLVNHGLLGTARISGEWYSITQDNIAVDRQAVFYFNRVCISDLC